MATIHVLQPPLTHEGAARLSASLITMIEAGVDPGPRGPQIRGSGASLEVLVDALRSRLAGLLVSDELNELLGDLERLSWLARTYEAD